LFSEQPTLCPQPLTALHDLSFVTEPDVRVLVIGEIDNLDFYREVTRGLGALEYLSKPVTRDMIARHFAPLVAGRAPILESGQGGRVLTITGVRGGVGATTIAVNLAWHFGVAADRHTVLLDPDLHMGTGPRLTGFETTSPYSKIGGYDGGVWQTTPDAT
jgi:pilus assembly protein CpaE